MPFLCLPFRHRAGSSVSTSTFPQLRRNPVTQDIQAMFQLLLAAIALILAYLRALVSAQNDVTVLGTTLPTTSTTTTTTTTTKDVAAATVGGASSTSTSSEAPAATITITVNRVANMFVPANVTAQVGDVVKFEFWPTNNSVARAAYGYPCTPYALVSPADAADGFWSGFKPVVANLAQVNITELPAYYIAINRVTPLWFYNSAPGACVGSQMVGVINPAAPSDLAVQKRAAAQATLALSPGEQLPPEGASASASSGTAAAGTAGTAGTAGAGAGGGGGGGGGSSSSAHVSAGAAAGIAVGCLVGVAGVGGGVWALRRRRIKGRRVQEGAGGGGGSGEKKGGGEGDGNGGGGGRSAVVSELPGSAVASSDGVGSPWSPVATWRGRQTVVSELSAYGELSREQIPTTPPDRRLPMLPEVQAKKEGPFELGS
ncbi:extracellular serine-rich protein [Diplodia corticola]|uniref:Extracellular serine-rich protein n=1 Tax=Diplodia corticola TaxID=236234 RepID=A0A1J9QL74_9PEZI|nr:extracellular serine-rich protein [Diplodia corticola]OJD29216.1 extracellular serine-rich protein [Diplodia corticola]